MVKLYDDDHSVIYRPLFPCTFKPTAYKGNETSVTIGIGGNIGHTYAIFQKALHRLKKHPKITLIATSPLVKNPPFGYKDQPDFLNAMIIINTSMQPLELLKYLLYIEHTLGRLRSFKDAPRTIDLDIIGFKGQKVDHRRLQIPHKDWKNRLSVTLPLYLCQKSNPNVEMI